MALTTTTNSVAIAADDNTITVASATGFSAGSIVKVGPEFMQVRKDYTSGTVIPVLRAQNGGARFGHGITSNVQVGTGEDFALAAAQETVAYPQFGRVRQIRSYGAAGAITLPTPGNDMVAILNGTGTLAMTLANPTKDQDGDRLTVIGNGKSASTVTYTTTGYGNAGSSYDKLTFQNAGQVGFELMAANGVWVIVGAPPITGTSTAVSIGID